MKKLLSVLLAVVLLISAVPLGAFTFTASAATEYTEGDYTYTVANGEATIEEVSTLISGDITTPSTLGGYPVTSIGQRAFWRCSRLTSVTFSSGVTNISDSVFDACDNITSVTIPESVTSIGYNGTEHEADVFSCDSLVSITVDGNNDYYSSIDGVLFDKSVSKIMCYPQGKSATSYKIPDSVTSIGNGAFEFCSNLTNIIIPDGVTSIGSRAFYCCDSLTSINIPDNVTSIGRETFSNTAYYNNELNWQNDVLYIDNCLIVAKSTISGDCIIKDGTRIIAAWGFMDCKNLRSITIPKSVTGIGNYAFGYCSGLRNVYITDLAAWCNIEFVVDSSGGYGDNPLYYASNLYLNGEIISGDIVLPDSVTRLGSGVFYGCDEITSITIPDSVTSIGDWVFWGCSGLTNVDVPDSVTSIGKWAFYACENLKKVTIGDGVESIGILAFDQSENLESIIVDDNNDNYCSIDGVLFDKTISKIICYPDGKPNSTYVIPSSVTNIGEYAFFNCNRLENIIITDSVTVIEMQAIDECSNLTDIYYEGGEIDKNNINIDIWNDDLSNATWHYNMLYPDALSNDWYGDAVRYVRDNGIITGYGDTGLFGTADNIQRQDFVVILARLAGVDLDNYQSHRASFTDVPKGAYYEKAIMWAADCGITTGYAGGTKFGVGDKITREQLVTFLYRYAKYANGGVAPTVSADAEQKAKTYADYNGVNDYAKETVIWALDKGVIKGQGGTHIAPGGNALRCEVAQIIYNIYLNDIF